VFPIRATSSCYGKGPGGDQLSPRCAVRGEVGQTTPVGPIRIEMDITKDDSKWVQQRKDADRLCLFGPQFDSFVSTFTSSQTKEIRTCHNPPKTVRGIQTAKYQLIRAMSNCTLGGCREPTTVYRYNILLLVLFKGFRVFIRWAWTSGLNSKSNQLSTLLGKNDLYFVLCTWLPSGVYARISCKVNENQDSPDSTW